MSDNLTVPHVIPFPAAREHYRMEIAMHVMAGFAAVDTAGSETDWEMHDDGAEASKIAANAARMAVLWADELLKALEKP